MVGWYHRLNEHEFEQIPGDSEGQGSLEWCSPWGHKESDMTERLNNNKYLNTWKRNIIIFEYKHSPIITFEYIEIFFLAFTALNNYNLHVWLFD